MHHAACTTLFASIDGYVVGKCRRALVERYYPGHRYPRNIKLGLFVEALLQATADLKPRGLRYVSKHHLCNYYLDGLDIKGDYFRLNCSDVLQHFFLLKFRHQTKSSFAAETIS